MAYCILLSVGSSRFELVHAVYVWSLPVLFGGRRSFALGVSGVWSCAVSVGVSPLSFCFLVSSWWTLTPVFVLRGLAPLGVSGAGEGPLGGLYVLLLRFPGCYTGLPLAIVPCIPVFWVWLLWPLCHPLPGTASTFRPLFCSWSSLTLTLDRFKVLTRCWSSFLWVSFRDWCVLPCLGMFGACFCCEGCLSAILSVGHGFLLFWLLCPFFWRMDTWRTPLGRSCLSGV